MMHTKDKLAAELRELGLEHMAENAAQGYYDDFLSPLVAPISTLVHDLAAAAGKTTTDHDRRHKILELRKRAMDGDFDSTTEESDAWAASPDGQDTMKKLGREKP